MQITIDLDSLQASGGPFSLKRLDFVPVDVVFKSGGWVVDLPYDAVGKLGVKLAPGNDFLAYTDHWAKEGIGSNAVYSFDVGLNTTATVTALASAPTLNAFIEVEWRTGGYRYFSSSLPISISDNVIQGDSPQIALPFSYDQTSITASNGNGQPTLINLKNQGVIVGAWSITYAGPNDESGRPKVSTAVLADASDHPVLTWSISYDGNGHILSATQS